MGYPWGKAPQADGTGTTSRDMQRIIGAQYVSSGILPNGGLQVTGTSSMAYHVSPGALFMWTSGSERLGMIVPVDETTVNTLPAPATGSRVDTVYVDGLGGVRVTQGTSIPEGVAIAKFTVAAGITSTAAAQQSVDRNFAIATGASLGRLHYFHDPANGVYGNISPMTLGTGRFTLPSDRLVDFRMTWTASAEPDGADQRTWGVARWYVHIVGPTNITFATNWHYEGVHPRTEFLNITHALSEGSYTVHYVQQRMGGARFRHHKGGPDGWLGNRFEVWDAGVSR